MSGDPFETVAIAYTQSQAGVMLSLLAWHGIPAYGMNLETVRSSAPLTLALGGIPIRVHTDAAEEARALFAEVVEAPIETEAEAARQPVDRAGNFALALFCFLIGGVPPPRLSASLVK